MNRAAEELLGWPPAALIGQNAFDLLPEESADLARAKMQQDEGPPYEIAGQNAAGQIVPLEAQGKTIDYHGRELRVLAMRDLSWRTTLKRLQQHTRELTSENLTLKAALSDRDHFGALVGASPTMQKVYERIIQAAVSHDPVIIYGETGSGKDLAARLIFELSDHHTRGFVPVNCGAVQEPLFEAAFFGYRKGAFTGATQTMSGYFEQVKGDVLFLDEVGKLSPAMQVKLLRVLNDMTYTPLGEQKVRQADLRLITATNQELRQLKDEGRIREDFFQRIHVLALEMPSLRRHREDIPLLIAHFIAQQEPAGPRQVPPDLMTRFMGYDWPGNVRELFNELRRWLNSGEVELGGNLPQTSGPDGIFRFPALTLSYNAAMQLLEQEYLTRALNELDGNRPQAANALGINARTLQRKLAKFQPGEDVI